MEPGQISLGLGGSPAAAREGPPLDLRPIRVALHDPEVRAFGGPPVEAIGALLDAEPGLRLDQDRLVTAGGRPVGRRLPHGSVILDHPVAGPRARLVELDPDGRLVAVVRRTATGAFLGARVCRPGGPSVAVLPGGAQHPLWGASDRLVSVEPNARSTVLTVCQTVDWDAIVAIPALADPTRLPPGTGTAVLNLLAGLARDQGSGPLAYRGPYPTEQLFWALVESFRFEGGEDAPAARFTANAEAAFRDGRAPAPAVRWIPAPHERRGVAPGISVLLRDGVETLTWDGRSYHWPRAQGLERREHRVLRSASGMGEAGGAGVVASLWALGQPLEDQIVLSISGNVLVGPTSKAPDPAEEQPLAAVWRGALSRLLPLEATPLLAGAIAATWPELRIVWGPVPHDLVAAEGRTLRLSWRLCRAYRAAAATTAPDRRRALARVFVRDVLGLLGDPVRGAATAWVADLSPEAREIELAAAAAVDRGEAAAGALGPLDELLVALAAGDAVPALPGAAGAPAD